MDAIRFDRLARSLGTGTASRRSLLGVGTAAAALLSGGAAADAGRCPVRKRCGRKCCSACFARKRDPNTGDPIGFYCCPADKVCRKPGSGIPDQCCYPDEECRPELIDSGASDSLCCRTCGDVCCLSSEKCENGACVTLGTARLPRNRR